MTPRIAPPAKRKTATKPKKALTATRLRELLAYDENTGEFRWLCDRSNRAGGQVAGSDTQHGYRVISVDDRRYYAHRLAWLYVHGQWPAEQIDHANGDGRDNRLSNLRECTNAENCQNLGVRKNNTSGLTGVHWSNVRRKWVAQIRDGGKIKPLGRYDSREDAHAAFLRAKSAAHRFQPVPRGM